MSTPNAGRELGPIDPERWRRIAALFDETCEKPAMERDRFLDHACGDDSQLRAEVEALLAADRRAGDFLERSALEQVPEALASLSAEEPGFHEHQKLGTGHRIGPWCIVREIGRGGMGAVYLAERADAGFEQRVAIKLMRAGSQSAETLPRFVQERRILARLDHPNIARLVDGGATSEGLPYFAMEYVQGEPITTWCARRQESLVSMLDLFRQAGRAVEFAHRNLIVHRDLKPSNIFVSERGEVKLLDFGIAKILEPDQATAVSSRRRLTLRYAAPEQIRNDPVTTATDVYSLGIVLYELLTADWPFRPTTTKPSEIPRLVLHTKPVAPSLALARPGVEARCQAWRRKIRGDLDNIVLKAIQREPAERYGSVQALLDDLERYRTGRPVAATNPTPAYRARRFVARRRRPLAGGALLLLALVGGLVGLSLRARSAEQERDQALDRARIVCERALVERRAEFGPESLEVAESLADLGAVLTDQHDYPRAETVLAEALAIRRKLLGDAHPDVVALRATIAHLRRPPGTSRPAGAP